MDDCREAYRQQDYAEALRLCRPLAEKGAAVAQTTLGIMYERGLGGLAQDDAEAVKWYRKAAEQGVAYAQDRLALMYRQGRGGLPQDYAEAPSGFASRPSRETLSRRPTSAPFTCRALASRTTTPRPRTGSERRPIRATHPLSGGLAECMRQGGACRTMRRLRIGTIRRPIRATRPVSGLSF